MKAIESASVLLVLAIFTGHPKPAAMQTDAPGNSTSSVISYTTALYTMIGIASFYSMVTLICCVLVVLNCCRGGKQRKDDKRSTPYKDLHLAPGSRLDTIIEESEYSRSSSFSKKQHEAGAFSFSNKSALEDLEHELQTTAETQLKDLPNEPAGEDLFIANEHALSLEKSGKTLEEDFADGIPKRGSAITTSFKKVVPMRNISENGGKPKIQPNDSPLLRYAPRGTAIPPSEVKVPFSEDVAESKTTAVAGTDQSPRHRKLLGSTGSPFSKRKNPATEIRIPSSSDLTDFKRKTSVVGSQSNNKVHPVAATGGLNTSKPKSGRVAPLPPGAKLPPLARNSPKLKPYSTAQGDSGHTSSPIRSRPIPKHPVPSHSPFLAHAVKDSAPTLAVHSMKSGNQGQLDSSSSSTSSGSDGSTTLTAEALLKVLLPVKKKWYIIGFKLKFDRKRLDSIKREQGQDTDKLIALCEEWVGSSVEATWTAMVGVLRSSLVEERELAETMERQYCWNTNSKTYN